MHQRTSETFLQISQIAALIWISQYINLRNRFELGIYFICNRATFQNGQDQICVKQSLESSVQHLKSTNENCNSKRTRFLSFPICCKISSWSYLQQLLFQIISFFKECSCVFLQNVSYQRMSFNLNCYQIIFNIDFYNFFSIFPYS